MPTWIDEQVVLAIHDEQLAEHGGRPGVDLGLLRSALARPQNLLAYEDSDVIKLSAAYAFGIARGHAFVDGNKRTSLVATETFLALNGHELAASDEGCLGIWLALAEGDLTEADLVRWLERHVTLISPGGPQAP